MGNTWKVVLATVIIFAAGVVTGGLLVRQSMARPWPKAQKQPNAQKQQVFTPGNMRFEFLRRAQRELDLTPGQRDRIDTILTQSQERTRKVMETVSPRLREELQRTREELREILTPPQRVQFDRLLKQQQRPREYRPPGREGPRERLPGPNQPPLPGGGDPEPETPPARPPR